MSQFGDYDSDEEIDINPDQAHDMLSVTADQVTKIQAVVKGRLARKDYVRRKYAEENPDSAEARAYRREVTRKMMEEEQWRRINDSKQIVNFEDTARERMERRQRADFAKGAAMREKMRRVNESKFEEMKHTEERDKAQKQALVDMDQERQQRLGDEKQKKIQVSAQDRGKRMSLSIQAAAQARSERIKQGKAKISSSPLIEEEEQEETRGQQLAKKERQDYALKAADVKDYQVNEGKEDRSGYCSGGACSVM